MKLIDTKAEKVAFLGRMEVMHRSIGARAVHQKDIMPTGCAGEAKLGQTITGPLGTLEELINHLKTYFSILPTSPVDKERTTIKSLTRYHGEEKTFVLGEEFFCHVVINKQVLSVDVPDWGKEIPLSTKYQFAIAEISLRADTVAELAKTLNTFLDGLLAQEAERQ